MNGIKSVFDAFGLVLGTTIGAGIFALPYIFYKSGWPASLLNLIVLTAAVIFAHHLFLKTLAATGRKGNLTELVRSYFGKKAYFLCLFAVVVGLFFALVAYIILGANFLTLIFPALPGVYAIVFFWIISAAPIVWEKEIFLKAEFWGSVGMALIILFIFFGSTNVLPIIPYPDAGASRYILPFGAILFSLAGWTAIEPLSKTLKNIKKKSLVLGLATVLVSCLYVLFVWGIFYSAEDISPDTLSGLVGWPFIKIFTLAFLGIFAVWTSYLPGAVEIKNSLKTLRLNNIQASALVFFTPLFLVVFGMKDFISVVSVAGGVFLAVQYLFIFLLAKKVLKPKGKTKWAVFSLIFIFVLAAIYETYYFLVG